MDRGRAGALIAVALARAASRAPACWPAAPGRSSAAWPGLHGQGCMASPAWFWRSRLTGSWDKPDQAPQTYAEFLSAPPGRC